MDPPRPGFELPTVGLSRRMHCLVIEDEADTARYICNGLQEAGHTATLVRDGVNGLHLATNERWDVIILDRMLPGGVDGLSIIATIRNLGKTTPVLILSALASLDERVRGLRGGGDDYLTKPFALSELLARIEALARRGATTGGQSRTVDRRFATRFADATGRACGKADCTSAARVSAPRIPRAAPGAGGNPDDAARGGLGLLL